MDLHERIFSFPSLQSHFEDIPKTREWFLNHGNLDRYPGPSENIAKFNKRVRKFLFFKHYEVFEKFFNENPNSGLLLGVGIKTVKIKLGPVLKTLYAPDFFSSRSFSDGILSHYENILRKEFKEIMDSLFFFNDFNEVHRKHFKSTEEFRMMIDTFQKLQLNTDNLQES